MLGKIRLVLSATAVVFCWGLAASAETSLITDQGVGLPDLAAGADVIVLAQVRDTDYIYRRDFPVAGSAFLKVLIAYKVDQPLDIIEVFEESLHAHECYFPNPTALEEGRRYLLFLKRDEQQPGRFRGLINGCALDVLVDRDSNYVVRQPLSGIQIADSLNEFTSRFEFADAYALENNQSLAPQTRDELLTAGWIEPWEGGYIYTSGVELSTVRQLMGENGVSTNRHHKLPQALTR